MTSPYKSPVKTINGDDNNKNSNNNSMDYSFLPVRRESSVSNAMPNPAKKAKLPDESDNDEDMEFNWSYGESTGVVLPKNTPDRPSTSLSTPICTTTVQPAPVTQTPTFLKDGSPSSPNTRTTDAMQQLYCAYGYLYDNNAYQLPSGNDSHITKFTDKVHGIRAEDFSGLDFYPIDKWTDVRSDGMEKPTFVLDNDASVNALRLVNVVDKDMQRAIAPVSLPMLAHFALRGPSSGALYSPIFNARLVSLANIVSSVGGKPSMKDTVYAKPDDNNFLGFNTTEMGVVMYSMHHFDEKACSYADLIAKCDAVGGQPIATITKAAIMRDDGNLDHFQLFSNSSCAVPVTKEAFNALRQFLGYSATTLDRTPGLTDLQGVLAGLAGVDLSTTEAYKKFCAERQIPFPVPFEDPDKHPTVCRAFSAFLRRHVNIFVACYEGNHRLYTCSTFREGWKPSLVVPAELQDDGALYQAVPADSRLNVDVSVRIALPPVDKQGQFDLGFRKVLQDQSKNTLRASNTAIKPTFKSFCDAVLRAFQNAIDCSLLRYVDIAKYIGSDYSTNTCRPDLYIQFRSQVIKAIVRGSLRHDPFLEQTFANFKGTVVSAKNLKVSLLSDFGSSYQDPLVINKTHRPYPVAVQVFAHLLMTAMFTENNFATVERYMEACAFEVPQEGADLDIHDANWIKRHLITPAIVVAIYLRDEVARTSGWKKMRRRNATSSFRSPMRKVSLLIHANFLASVMDALSKYGPNPEFDENANPLLAEAVKLQVNGCTTWVEVALDFYVAHLRQFHDSGLSVRAPTTSGKWDGTSVNYETFDLARSYKPMSVIKDILDCTVEFNPPELQKAVQKARQEQEKLQDGHNSADGSDINEDDEDEVGAGKKKRLPPFQPAFTRLLVDMKEALDQNNIAALRTSFAILSEMAPVLKVGKQKGTSGDDLSTSTEKYVRDAYASAKLAMSQDSAGVHGSDQSLSSDPNAAETSFEIVD